MGFLSLMCIISDRCSNYSPGPVSQVDGNCTTLGCLLSNKCDSPIHQNGLSPKSILEYSEKHSNVCISLTKQHMREIKLVKYSFLVVSTFDFILYLLCASICFFTRKKNSCCMTLDIFSILQEKHYSKIDFV